LKCTPLGAKSAWQLVLFYSPTGKQSAEGAKISQRLDSPRRLFKFNKNAISLNWHKKLIPRYYPCARSLLAMTPNLFRLLAGDVNKFPSSLLFFPRRVSFRPLIHHPKSAFLSLALSSSTT